MRTSRDLFKNARSAECFFVYDSVLMRKFESCYFMFKNSFFSNLSKIGAGKSAEIDKQAHQSLPLLSSKDNTELQSAASEDDWTTSKIEGQLSVDVYETDQEIVIQSAIAGVEPQDLDISVSSDMVTIRGSRADEKTMLDVNYLYQECYWGSFSRSIILPQEVKAENAVAEFKKGILTIKLPKTHDTHTVKIKLSD